VLGFATRLFSLANRLLRAMRVQLVSTSELAALQASSELPEPAEPADLPAEVAAELQPDNPRLSELRRRYAGHPAAAGSRWTSEFVGRQIDLSRFRSDSPYVWSERDAYVRREGVKTRVATRAVNYVLSGYYAREQDDAGILQRITDDGLFGNRRVAVDRDLTVSRDLLDSVLELNFLERHLGISQRATLTVLDIGAGYGRFAHRLAEAFPHARAVCTDGVPESSFLCEYYLRFRGVDDRAQVVPLDELASRVAPGEVDLAVNIHSWSECPLAVIRWWLGFLADRRVRHLMVVPNDGEQLLSLEHGGDQLDFAPALEQCGYRPLLREPKFGDTSCQRLGVYPTYYHLFELHA